MERHDYIGSSDAAKILDESQWGDLYAVKTGEIEREDLSDVFRVQLGVLTEPFHVRWVARKREWDISTCKTAGEQHFATIIEEEGVVLGSHPDALILNDEDAIYPLEVKHSGNGFRDTVAAADYYMPQLQHHMLCWDVRSIAFSVILGNQEPDPIWVGASDEWQKQYLKKASRFWAFLKNRMPPPSLVKTAPPKVSDITFDGMKRVDISGNNLARAMADRWLVVEPMSREFAALKKEFKDMLKDDELELTAPGISVKRTKAGVRTTITPIPEGETND